ncbi:MAG: AI-2E family transporter, partial [bacterium]
PKVLGKQIGLHPLATLISIYVGFKLMGLIGLILAPMVLVIIITLIKENIIKI